MDHDANKSELPLSGFALNDKDIAGTDANADNEIPDAAAYQYSDEGSDYGTQMENDSTYKA